MRYKYPEKTSLGNVIQMILITLFFLVALSVGIWYQWLDISTKLAIRDMAKQQQESKP
jgi:hypothetical protein